MHSLFLKILIYSLIQCASGQANFWDYDENVTQIEEDFRIDDVTKILKRLGNYNRNAYPLLDQDLPTHVDIQMYIEGMSSFHAQSMGSSDYCSD
uniref:Peptidase_M14 domain-containing protein n=1 Tax=Caenorhabditis tropicalis TaxID=1561998 RepID=A0A1I7UQQ8_9PELO